MKHKDYSFGFSLPLMMTAATALVGCDEKPERPNIIFIIADDLGYGDLGCYGQKIIATPNIDRLAQEGMRFTQFYAGCTVSAPSRSSLVTGLHTGHTPIRGNKSVPPEGQWPQPLDTYTIGKMLKHAGYATGCFGKWGLGYPGSEGAPDKQGFDEFFGYNCQSRAHNYYPRYLWHNSDTVWLHGNDSAKTEQYAQDIIHSQALRFISDNKDRPFFAFLTYIIPHAELINPDDSILALYKGKFPEKPFKGVDEGANYKMGGYGSSAHPKADFAAMVTRLDAYTGEIMSLLKREGIDRQTLIVFTSDNGPHREGGAAPDFFGSNLPLRGYKRDMYEGGIRIPFIVSYPPRIKSGAVSNHIGAFWDVMPSFAELAGVNNTVSDGISFVPTLFGRKKQKQHDFLYWEFHEQGGKQAVRKGDWKAVRLNVFDPAKTKVELFNLANDIHEDNDVSSQHPDIVAEMINIMESEHTDSEVFPFK